MRLSKIRIAGFKSFVDPVTLDLQSHLVGILGPNGCGKSNTIDAVRWVMGESSAKHLRGQSMEDVIFNGSATRKPVGQASVELIFDNSDGRLGGEFAHFSEIAIKRVASRDGKSQYYLNGTKCRRRDITDIFLGTGLGPRSYAIIEQGMISRLIEAKPEELRHTIEEAAGISRYKERRRETEVRMKHTRDNLERIKDVREEVDKQLSRLEKQAKSAQQFREWRQEEQALQAQCVLLRWQTLQTETATSLTNLNTCSQQYQTELAQVQAQQQTVEIAREQVKQAQTAMHQAQGEYYEASATVSRTEQALQHQQILQQRQAENMAQLTEALAQAQKHEAEDRQALAQCQAKIHELEPQLQTQTLTLQQYEAQVAQTQQQLRIWQQQWNALQQQIALPTQNAQVEKARLEQLERQEAQLQQRISRLQQEATQLAESKANEDGEELTQALEATREKQLQLNDQFIALEQQLPALQQQLQQWQIDLDQSRQQQQQITGRLSALTTLQQTQLHKDNTELQDWLSHKDWQQVPRLAEVVKVAQGWERALEVVLGQDIEAICLETLHRLSDIDWPSTGMSLFQAQIMGERALSTPTCPLPTLASKVQYPMSLPCHLQGIYCAENLAIAFQYRETLAAQESIITPNGLWLGRYCLRISAQQDHEESSILQRQQSILLLQQQQTTLKQQIQQLQQQITQNGEQLQQKQQQIQAWQQDLNQLHRQETQQEQALHALQQQQAQWQQRQQRLTQDREELLSFQQELATEQQLALEQRNEALLVLEGLLEQRQQHEQEKHHLQQQLTQQQAEYETANQLCQTSQIALQTHQQQYQHGQRQLERLAERLQDLAQQQHALQQSMQEEEPQAPLREALLTAQAAKEATAIQLKQRQQAAEQAEQQEREQDETRLTLAHRAEATRHHQEQLKLAWQALAVKEQHLAEQFQALDVELAAVEQQLVISATQFTGELLPQLQQQLSQIQQSIQRLGAINLAAIDEFKSSSERKSYLDQQYNDLNQALETLEAAIRKIDRETKVRFKDTFDRINQRLGEMFPRLFAGGECYLEMTDNDLLKTGIAIMARPPGKRISNIYLMSGGEKALTAVALVFAIFELNPAPFCLLDEVDAPLDEANVGRFADLVRHMAERVQFIFITHNRATMELAENLIGVTMREAGVSRIVAVDVAKAAQFANG